MLANFSEVRKNIVWLGGIFGFFWFVGLDWFGFDWG